ncbi:MAG: PepSY domain-containing protein [Cyanobacteria bacterium J06639_1]
MHLRKLHATLAPVMVMPLLVTLVTGSLFQIAAAAGLGDDYLWLLELHRGKFGRLNLELVYPFLNAFGLLTLAVTGLAMWWRTKPRRTSSR